MLDDSSVLTTLYHIIREQCAGMSRAQLAARLVTFEKSGNQRVPNSTLLAQLARSFTAEELPRPEGNLAKDAIMQLSEVHAVRLFRRLISQAGAPTLEPLAPFVRGFGGLPRMDFKPAPADFNRMVDNMVTGDDRRMPRAQAEEDEANQAVADEEEEGDIVPAR